MINLDSERPRWLLPDLDLKLTARRLRLLGSKALAVSILVFAFLSRDVYADGSLVEISFKGLAFLLLFSSALGRCWTTAYISGKKAMVLVQEGPYSMVRNPLYFFSFLGYLGAGLAFQSLLLTAAMSMVFLATHGHNILHEERWLRQKFGLEYEEYCRAVPRFFPKPWLLREPAHISVSPARFSRTVLESSMLSLVFGLALVGEWCHANAVLPVLFWVH